MKGLITSGGRGTRLRPITHTLNKHLIPIANRPMLFYALDNMAEAGIKEVGIIVPKGEREVPDAIGSGADWGLRITYIEQEAPLGLAHCIRISEDFIDSEPFLFYLGDNMVLGGASRFVENFQAEKCDCLLTIAAVKDPERFGVPEIRDGKIVRIVEKPLLPKSRYAVAGIYLYNSSIFEAVKAISPSARGEFEISDAHQYLLDSGRNVSYCEITGWWKDTGKPEDLLDANALALDAKERSIEGDVDEESILTGRVVVEKGAVIRKSRIDGPAIIGAGSEIERSRIGASTSVFAGCYIRNSEIEYSLVLADCRIDNVDKGISHSIIGSGTTVTGAGAGRPKHTLIIGDQSIVELT